MAEMFDPHKNYTDDEYSVTGAALNQIGQLILDLKREVKNLKETELNQELTDLRVRDKNPSVKDAWDQYQTVLGLASK